ncbi:MFS transporter [Qipengyuania algicida]|uniref:MFS transporter n=1 Tax=Qipengyuania algicida TaxID=1836209 RepID=UPI00301DD352
MRELGISGAFVSVTVLFFAWGFISSNNDPLIVALRAIFGLNYTEALSTQLVFFLASGLISLPAASLGNRFGQVPSIIVSLAGIAIGCLLVRMAASLASYELILCALFVMAAGITSLQVAANPLAAAMGPNESSHFRLNFAQSFNSLGVVIGVHFGTMAMLGGQIYLVNRGRLDNLVERRIALASIETAYGVMALAIAALALFIWLQRKRISQIAVAARPEPKASVLDALKSKWALFGALAIGLYVGAEVAIGSIMIVFLHRSDTLGMTFEDGGRYLANIYWGGALVGRLIGTILLTKIPATRLLGLCAAISAALCAIVCLLTGPMTGYAALAIGLFNSIMFPTIFSLTLERSGASNSSTSGLLCLAIIGGAVVPLVVGLIADSTSLSSAFIVPAGAYLAVGLFAWRAAHIKIQES